MISLMARFLSLFIILTLKSLNRKLHKFLVNYNIKIVSKQYKKPDLNAPRFRPKKLNLTNVEFYKDFIKDNPKYANITVEEFKEIITKFNGKIWEKIIECRDGVELPEQLGYIFIGSCPRKKSNIDFKKSNTHGIALQHQNWESDQFAAKVFYTNYETKYRFKNHEFWGFKGLRDFTRTVAQTYPKEWKKYIQVDNLVKVSRLFRKEKFKQLKDIETKDLLYDYDEFNML